jgi:hypothetical protein
MTPRLEDFVKKTPQALAEVQGYASYGPRQSPHTQKISGAPQYAGSWGEDWDLIYADSRCVEEFCEIYERESLTESDKFALCNCSLLRMIDICGRFSARTLNVTLA